MTMYKTILIDPPYSMTMYGKIKVPSSGYLKGRKSLAVQPYSSLSDLQIEQLPVFSLSDEGTHLWLWTTHDKLAFAISLYSNWGFKYQVCLTWIKSTGFGNWWRKTTQFLLFGYRSPLTMKRRMFRTDYYFSPKKHSQKPDESYTLIESISDLPRIELFARPFSPLFQKRKDWDVWGNEVESDITLEYVSEKGGRDANN